jgi:Kef-type K+ transport system membrane component KefB
VQSLTLTLGAAGTSGVMADLVIILATAGAVTLVLRKLRLATIPAYLIAGAIIGPFALKLVVDTDSIGTISHIAVILLMFGLGMHMDPAELKGRFVPILGVGVGACVIVSGAIMLTLVAWIGWALALLVGLALSMSSTAAVLRILQGRRELDQVHGQLSFGVLIVQDLLVVGVLALTPLLVARAVGAPAPEPEAEPISMIVLLARALTAIGAIGLVILVGRIVLPKVLEIAAGGGDADVLLVVAGAAALGAAALTARLGFTAELGAFIAGLLLSATPLRFQIAGQLAPMRDLFMAVFFVSVGLYVNVEDALAGWWIVLLGTLGLLVLKACVIGGLSWAVGASAPVAVLTGLALAQGGEFTLVVLGAARDGGLVFESESLVVSVVALSLIVTPWLIQLGHALAGRATTFPPAPWVRRSALRERGVASAVGQDGHVIIAGFGPIGRAVAEHLESEGRAYTVVEMNASTVKRQTALGRSVVYGDASNPDVLRSAGVESASAVILTIPDDGAMLRAVRAVRVIAPEVFIAARANFMSKALQAKQLGANYVVAEEVATAEAMAQQVAAALGGGMLEGRG